MFQMGTAASLKVKDGSTKALAWRSTGKFLGSKFMQRNLNWQLVQGGPQVLQPLTATMSKSRVAGPFSSRERNGAANAAKLPMGPLYGHAPTASVDFSVPVVLNHVLTETDQQA